MVGENGLAVSTGTGRAAFGALGLFAPRAIAVLGDLDLDNRSARYMTRLFGARDLVLGAMTVLPSTRRFGLTAGLIIDLLDTGSGVAAAREGATLRSRTATIGGAIPFIIGGALALRAARTPS